MSEQPQSTPSQIFYLEIIVPALFLFFVIYGLPPILTFAAGVLRHETACPQSAEAPTASPPASGTGPTVAGDGGETG